MTTRMYWALEHIQQAARELRFRAACWSLNQQVELLNSRLRLGSVMPSMQSYRTGTPVTRIGFTPEMPLRKGRTYAGTF